MMLWKLVTEQRRNNDGKTTLPSTTGRGVYEEVMIFLFLLAVRKVKNNITTWPKVCGHLLVVNIIPKSWALLWRWFPFAYITASTVLGRLSTTRCWNSFHFSHKNITEVGR
jgi:hypothetical protein